MDTNRKQQVESVLEQMRPWIQSDGGDVSLLDISNDGVVTVQLEGNCVGCGAQQMTIDEGIKAVMASQLDWVTDVIATEDATPAEKGPSIRSTLEKDGSETESLLVELDDALLSMTAADLLPEVVHRWFEHTDSRLAMLMAREEECVFPVLRDYLNTAAGPVGLMRKEHDELRRKQEEFRIAAGEYQSWNDAALKRLRDAGRAVTRQMSAHLIKERTSVFELLDRALPEDLRNELLQDLQRYEAGYTPPAREGAKP